VCWESEGIQLVDSTTFLKPLIPAAGVLTRRAPDAREAADIAYGREIARQIAGLDLGRRSWFVTEPVWPSRPWKGPTKPSSAGRSHRRGRISGRGEGQASHGRTCDSMYPSWASGPSK